MPFLKGYKNQGKTLERGRMGEETEERFEQKRRYQIVISEYGSMN